MFSFKSSKVNCAKNLEFIVKQNYFYKQKQFMTIYVEEGT